MKKLISLLLIIVVVCSFCLNVGAESYDLLSSSNSGMNLLSNASVLSEDEVIYVRYLNEERTLRVYAYLRTVSTPNTPDAVQAYYAITDLDEIVLRGWEDYVEEVYENAVWLAPATTVYNCHSYAWHSQGVYTNRYWIDNPQAYYTDGSYCVVTTPQANDIICYFDDNGTPNDTSDDKNLHSGIVTEVLSGTSNGLCGNSDLVVVTSKWGNWALYRHNGYECPYTTYRDENSEGSADYVKYYRFNNCSVEYTYDTRQHIGICTKCGNEETSLHTMTVKRYNLRQHKRCCAVCDYEYYENHMWNTDRTSCTVCGFNIEGSQWRLNKLSQDMYTYE